jgi:chromosome segregation ATPase
MASQPNTLDAAQLQGIVAWLEDQQKADREQIARLAAEVERLTLISKEQAVQVVELRSALDEGRTSLARLPLLDQALKQEREQVVELRDRFDGHTQQITQALLLRAADAERDRKLLGEQGQAIQQLEREQQTQTSRFRALADEVRRDRAQVESLPKSIDELVARVSQVAHRIEQTDDSVRRSTNLSQANHDELEGIRSEQAKAAQWRQLTELRWTRQVAEWQQMIENWRAAADEAAKPVQHLHTQVGQLRDELRTRTGDIADQVRRIEDAHAALGRLDSALAQTRESIARLEQGTDAQRRRFDEQASAQLRLDESIGRVVDARQATEGAVQAQARQIEVLQADLRAVEASVTRVRSDLTDGQQGLRADSEAIRTQVTQSIERIEAAARSLVERLLEAQRASQEHRQRLAIELEAQARELGELAARLRPA